jgi:hypothetical protein
MSNNYHCSIYAISEIALSVEDITDFKPFRNAHDMTMHLGITVDEWRERQRRQRAEEEKNRQAKKRGPRGPHAHSANARLQNLVAELMEKYCPENGQDFEAGNVGNVGNVGGKA